MCESSLEAAYRALIEKGVPVTVLWTLQKAKDIEYYTIRSPRDISKKELWIVARYHPDELYQ